MFIVFVMATKDWKLIKNDRIQKRWIDKNGNWIYVTKTSLIKEWEVSSNKNINPSSNNPNFKYFKSTDRGKNKSQAMAYARQYMRSH